MLGLAFRIGAFILGTVLILLGILGLFLPFLQGILLIALGLSVMSMVSPRVAGWVDAMKARVTEYWRGRRQAKGQEGGESGD